MSDHILPQLQIGRIPGFPNYLVLSSGSVWHKYHTKGVWRRKATSIDRYGYKKVNLSEDDQKQSFYIHSIILTVFIGQRPKDMECRHLDGNKLNNRLENLCWGTPAENAADMRRHGTYGFPSTKLTPEDVRDIRQRVKNGKYGIQTVLAKEYGVCDATISTIVNGKNWRRIPEIPEAKTRR